MTPRWLLIIGTFAWCAAIAVTPLLASLGGTGTQSASLSYDFFSRVCHQFDSRSFHLAGYKFAVCIRCFTIYASFFLGMIFYPLVSRTRIVVLPPSSLLIISLIPMGIDVTLATLGIHDSSTTTRIVTGFLFGLALSIVLVPTLEEVTGKLISHFKMLSHLKKLTQGTTPMAVNAQRRKHCLRNPQSALNLRNPSNCQTIIEHPQRTPYAAKTR